MQAHLRDVTSLHTDKGSFIVCQRVLHRCHEIIFEDAPGLVSGPYANMKVVANRLISRRRIKHIVQPTIVGIACVLAGVPAMPRLTEEIGAVAVEQGRADTGANLRSLDTGDDSLRPVIFRASQDTTNGKDDEDQDEKDESSSEEPNGDHAPVISRTTSQSQKLREAAQTTPTLPSLDGIRRSEATDDPFGQRDSSSPPIQPSRSSPVIPMSKRAPSTGSGNLVDNILQQYDNTTQRQLLRSHYCRSEVSRWMSDRILS